MPKLQLTSPNGGTLNTAGTYCDNDIEIIPKLQTKTVTENGTVTADDGYAGLGEVVVDVQSGGGAEFNIAYGDTAPSDTSKLWVKTAEPSGVHVSANVEGSEKLEVLQIDSAISKRSFCSCKIGDNIYLIGGSSNGDIYCFNAKTKTTSMVATLPSYYDAISCCAIGTDIYICGGGTSKSCTNTIRKFNTIDNTFTQLSATLTTTLNYTSCATVNGYVYVFGGQLFRTGYGTSYYTYVRKIDPTTDTAEALGLPEGRSAMGCCAVGKNIYLFGGNGASGAVDTIYKFDTETEKFETLQTVLPSARTCVACCSMGSNIYIFGGASAGGQILKFETTTESIEILPTTLPIAISEMCAEADGNNCFLFGGYGNSTVLNEIYEFTIDLPLEENNIEILTGQSGKACKIVRNDSMMLEVGVKGVYIGNADGVAEKAEAYLHNGTEWVAV